MAKNPKLTTLDDSSKAILHGAMRRAVAVLESDDNGGKPVSLDGGSYPVDVSVRITGDLNVAKGSPGGKETPFTDIKFTDSELLESLYLEVPEGQREQAICNAIKRISERKREGDDGRKAAAFKGARTEIDTLKLERGKKHKLVETGTTTSAARAGAVSGKPTLEITAFELGEKRDLTFRIGA